MSCWTCCGYHTLSSSSALAAPTLLLGSCPLPLLPTHACTPGDPPLAAVTVYWFWVDRLGVVSETSGPPRVLRVYRTESGGCWDVRLLHTDDGMHLQVG